MYKKKKVAQHGTLPPFGRNELLIDLNLFGRIYFYHINNSGTMQVVSILSHIYLIWKSEFYGPQTVLMLRSKKYFFKLNLSFHYSIMKHGGDERPVRPDARRLFLSLKCRIIRKSLIKYPFTMIITLNLLINK